MPYREDHGGDCCGISHWIDFGGSVTADELRSLDRLIERAKERKYEGERRSDWSEYTCGFSHLNEVVLTDNQMMTWAPELKKRGFRLMHRFFNSNSGNYCTVLFYNPYGPRGRNRVKPPYKW